MHDINQLILGWRNGLYSDVEAMYFLCGHLPPSPVTDLLIEVAGKMYQEEVAEWPQPCEDGPHIEHLPADTIESVDDVDYGQPMVDPHSDSKL